MKTTLVNSADFAPYVYRKQNIRDNTLDNAQLEARCPLDNGRHSTLISTSFSANHLDRLPLELITEVLLQLDIPSLTRFRSLNRRAMEFVNSVRQYAAIIKHCPNIIRAIVSIQADGFSCDTLYRTLCTSRSSTCSHFGYHLYLIDCRRVCYICFTRRPEYFPLTSCEAYKLFTSTKPQSNPKHSRKLFKLAKLPSILSLPGRYCSSTISSRNLTPKRVHLYNRQAVVQSLAGSGLPQSDKTTGESKRFMAIISAPVLLNGGKQADQGFFCLGCKYESDKTKHFRIKYTAEDMPGHIARYGQVVALPGYRGRFMHTAKPR